MSLNPSDSKIPDMRRLIHLLVKIIPEYQLE